MNLRMKFTRILAACLLATGGVAHSQEGWTDLDSESRRLNLAAIFAGEEPPDAPEPAFGPPMGLTSPGEPSRADEITPEIQALARGLRHDPWRIYQYCWERVSFEPYWGSKKGATTTLLEGSGNCFDTASLMVALLKASGVADVGYRYGQRYFYPDELQSWLGILSPFAGDGNPFPDLTTQQFRDKFNIPSTTTVTNTLKYEYLAFDYLVQSGVPLIMKGSGATAGALLVPHVWVRFRDSAGVLREMDPTVKLRELYMEEFYRPTGAEIGYSDRTAFLNGLGGVPALSGRQITGISTTGPTGLDAKLSQFTQGFRAWLRAGYHDTYTDDFINRNHPAALTGTIGAHTLLSGVDYETANPVIGPTTWTEIPKQWESRVAFTFGKNYNATSKTFGTEYGSVDIPTNVLNCGTLSITNDGTTVRLRHGEAVLKSVTVPESTFELRMAVNHPVGEISTGGVFTDTGFSDGLEVKTYQRNNDAAYAILYGFDPSPQHLRKSQERLDAYRRLGLHDTDWQVRTEALNVMGLTYLVNVKNSTRMVATRVKVLERDDHTFGRMSQEGAYYIDVGLSMGLFYSYAGRADTRRTAFHVSSHFASALEHGIIEQLQGPGVQAISTMKVLQLANAQGHPLHLVDSSNWSSVRSTLATGNGWLVGSLDRIESSITGTANVANNAQILLPRRGDIGLTSPPAAGQWRGYGYALTSNVISGMLISGGYSGGYLASGSGTVSSTVVTDYGHSEPGYYSLDSFLNGTAHDSVTIPKWVAADPVDMASGAFTYEATDLQCGFPMPRGLSFHRSYSSNRSSDDSQGLGYGWSHNLDIRASRRSASRAAFGDTTPEQMAPTYAAVMVATDVFQNRSTAKDWAVVALTSCWGVDQIRDNAVSVQMGAASLEFVKMPNGDFVPPSGITLTLTPGVGGTLALAERHGNTHHFNADGRITSTVDQHSKQALYAYKTITVAGTTKTVLDKVTDMYGREMKLTWVDGRIEGVTESAGALTRSAGFIYTGGNLTAATDPESKPFVYGYEENRIVSMTDGRGRIITENEYDDQGRVYEQRLHGDPSKTFQLFFSGIRNTERNPKGGETTYVYDRRGRGVSIVDAFGNTSSVIYDGHNRKLEVADPENNYTGTYRPTKMVYNADHNLTGIQLPKRGATDPNASYTASKEYDAQLRLWKESDFKGKKTVYTYTTKHQVETVTDRKGQLVQTNVYNTDGTLASVKDGANKITKYLNYDSFGNPQTIEYPAVTVDGVQVAPTETFLFDSRGNLREHTDRNSNKTTTTYNERRQPRVITLAPVDGVSHSKEIEYDDAGNACRAKDANGNWTQTEISQTGKILSTALPATAAGTSVIRHSYDSVDWLEWSKDPLGNQITFVSDIAGRTKTISDPLSRVAENFYDRSGRVNQTKDFRFKNTFYRYNWRGELYQTENALTHLDTTAFDANGAKDAYTNKRVKLFDFGYDDNGRQTSLKTPLLKEETQGWTIRGQLDFVQEASTDRTEFIYNDMGQVRQTLHKQGGATVATVTRYRDKQGNVKKLEEGTKDVEYSYDARNRMRTFTDVTDKVVGYRYYGNGNLKELIYPDGRGSVYYTYDALNRLETVKDWANRETRYHYDLAGRIKRVERANGTERRFSFDAASQLTGVSEVSSAEQPIFYSIHRYDTGGRRDREKVFPAPHAFTATTFGAVLDNDNRISSFNGTAATYDNDGNLTVGPLGATPSSSFVYESRNRLTSAGGLTYGYDPAGTRTSVTSASGEIKWTIDPNGTLSRALVREKGGVKTWYVYGLGLLYEIAENAETTTYHFDSRGSTVALTKDDGTTILDRFEYDPHGRETWRLANFDTPFRYQGASGIQTDANGLCHMRARYYHPQIRRFLNADPSGFNGGTNWHQYAAGNPIACSDPLGLEPSQVSVGGKEALSCIQYVPSPGGVGSSDATWDEVSPWVHGTLDVAGMIPVLGEPMDGVNGAIYFAEGNKVDGSLSLAAMIPIVGWGATGTKALRYVDEVVEAGEHIDEIYEIAEGVRRSKAADIMGHQTITARIIREGQEDVFQEIPISSLRSPKDVIDVRNFDDADRFATTLQKTRQAPVSQGNGAIDVRPGSRGVPISDVRIIYPGSK